MFEGEYVKLGCLSDLAAGFFSYCSSTCAYHALHIADVEKDMAFSEYYLQNGTLRCKHASPNQ